MARRPRRRGAHSAPRRRDRDRGLPEAGGAPPGDPEPSPEAGLTAPLGATGADGPTGPAQTDDTDGVHGLERVEGAEGGSEGTDRSPGEAEDGSRADATAPATPLSDDPVPDDPVPDDPVPDGPVPDGPDPTITGVVPVTTLSSIVSGSGAGGGRGGGSDGGGSGGGGSGAENGGGSPEDSGPAPRRRRKRRRTALQRLLLAAILLLVLALVAMGSSYAYVSFRFNQVKKVSVPHLRPAPVGQPFNVLLIGSDSRSDIPSGQSSAFGNEEDAGGQRSDVVKIVHIVPATGQASVLSIPRDTMVTVAGNTANTGQYNRINTTYAEGPDQLVQTIQDNFGIPISHVVQVDFAGFQGAVNAIGGIYLSFPYPAKDDYSSLDITQTGCQLLNGFQALAVARSRHYQYEEDGYWQYDPTSDFGRIQRQNAFLRAVINQAETKYNPLTLNAFVGSVAQSLTIDSTFTVKDLVTLASEFHTFSSSSLGTMTLPTYSESSYEFSSLGDVLYVQQPQADQVITQFLGGEADPVTTPPPGPDGPVPTTTTSPTLPGTTATTGGTTSSTEGEETTTTIDTDYDPVPCSPSAAG